MFVHGFLQRWLMYTITCMDGIYPGLYLSGLLLVPLCLKSDMRWAWGTATQVNSQNIVKESSRVKNVLFKFFLASLKKSKVILIFWSVNFHSGNMVRDWQTELSAKESDLRQSLQISQISIWIGSISEWCNFDRHTSHSGRRFSEEKKLMTMRPDLWLLWEPGTRFHAQWSPWSLLAATY